MSREIKLYKLVTGEEIIGGLQSYEWEKSDSVTLSKVRVMLMQPMGQGQMSIAMIPWMVGAPDSDIVIYKRNIAGEPHGSLPTQLVNGYLSNTSGLDLTSGMTNLETNK